MDDTAATDDSTSQFPEIIKRRPYYAYFNPLINDARLPTGLNNTHETGWKMSLQGFRDAASWFRQENGTLTGTEDGIMHSDKGEPEGAVGSSESRESERQRIIRQGAQSHQTCIHSMECILPALRFALLTDNSGVYQDVREPLLEALTHFYELTGLGSNDADSQAERSQLLSKIEAICSDVTTKMEEMIEAAEKKKKAFAIRRQKKQTKQVTED